VTQVDHFHPSDAVIGGVVIATQYVLGRMLFTVWKTNLPRAAFRVIGAALGALWVVVALAIVLGLLGMVMDLDWWIPAPFRAFLSAVETITGLISACTLTVYGVYRWAGRRVNPQHSPTRRRLLRTAGAAAMIAPAAILTYGGLIEREKFLVREIDFPIPNLHPDLEGLRVAQISDLHVSPYLSVRDAGRVVDITNGLNPNLTLVTGDLISGHGDPLDATIAELARLRAEAGVLGCLGNHEVYAKAEDHTEQAAGRRGIKFLRGRAETLRWGKGVLNVAGVDFERFSNRRHYLEGAGGLVLPGASNLLLSHNPDVFPVAVRQGYDAVIGGHTHGGQVTVEILNQTLNLARFFTPYVAGLYRLDGRSCYVNAGIGTIGMPVRIGAPPEITLFRLRRA
jgi:predicted MPP superfamily phosphohydrolase